MTEVFDVYFFYDQLINTMEVRRLEAEERIKSKWRSEGN